MCHKDDSGRVRYLRPTSPKAFGPGTHPHPVPTDVDGISCPSTHGGVGTALALQAKFFFCFYHILFFVFPRPTSFILRRRGWRGTGQRRSAGNINSNHGSYHIVSDRIKPARAVALGSRTLDCINLAQQRAEWLSGNRMSSVGAADGHSLRRKPSLHTALRFDMSAPAQCWRPRTVCRCTQTRGDLRTITTN